jgi:hypothetical protein
VRCNVGDWVEVLWDYSPGVCSEGGTGVVIALNEGTSIHIFAIKEQECNEFVAQILQQ